MWTYQTGAWNIAHPTWLLDYPILHYRVPLWMLWVNRIDGLLYWQTTYWSQVADPWTDTRTYRDGTRVYNGEGSLFYPGNAVGYNGPIVSARLKALRDGMEDYEYLKILAGIIGVSGANSLASSVATRFTSWNPSPANLQAIREAVAQRITNPSWPAAQRRRRAASGRGLPGPNDSSILPLATNRRRAELTIGRVRSRSHVHTAGGRNPQHLGSSAPADAPANDEPRLGMSPRTDPVAR